MTCPTCSTEALDGSLYCRNCLHVVLEVDEPLALRGDEYLLILLEACEMFLQTRWDAESFHEFISDFEQELQGREQAIHALEIPSHLEADFAEEQDVGLGGVSLCNTALQMLATLHEPDRDSVVRALERFHEGVARITEAMRINRRNRDRPLYV